VSGGETGAGLRGEAIAELRHELRTPVNIITGYSEMLLEDAVGSEEDAELAEALRGLGEQMREVLRIINASLPSGAATIAPEGLRTLAEALRERQTAVLALLDAADASPSARREEVVEDIARMRVAAGRLAHVEVADAKEAETREFSGTVAEAALRADATASARILVVDDVEDNRTVLGRRLERLGHVVTTVESGTDALALSAEREFDLILLDVLMPGLDGYATLLALKGRESTRELPVVMISALDDLAHTARCIAQGAEDYLPKPFDPLLLQARVGASLERKRLRDREREFLAETMIVVEAAQAVEEGRYDGDTLQRVARRDDALGRLARVFDGMAAEVKAREERLERQLRALREEIDASRTASPGSASVPMVEVTPAAHAEDTTDLLRVGARFAERYDVLEMVGQGGMGRVYRANDAELGAEVAIKTIRASALADDPQLVDGFKSEIRLSRLITHPNVVRTHDLGVIDGMVYITMEYVRGVSLRGMIEARGHIGPSAALALGAQLCRALEAAHAQGVVHRDIKPENVVLSHEGVLKVMDFGIAQLVQGLGEASGTSSGTVGYMAPEQLLGEPADARADLYAVGVVLFECVTGRRPFASLDPFVLVSEMLRSTPPEAATFNAEVSPAFSALLASLLLADPNERPASAGQVAAQLEAMR
jgi:CheY-like chemotaxis protein